MSKRLACSHLLPRKTLLPGVERELYWDATYAIVLALMERYPRLSPAELGLQELAHLVEGLPGFQDDPALATERILLDIQSAWFEEASS
ncbi:MAG: Fe-S cluster assembly protein IscX [Chloroflexota bacterium]